MGFLNRRSGVRIPPRPSCFVEAQGSCRKERKRTILLSITHKLGALVHDCFDFVGGDVERDVHGALARAFRRSVSMSLCSLR